MAAMPSNPKPRKPKVKDPEAKTKNAFKVFDLDNDGYITKEEFLNISKKANKKQVEAVFNKFDKDGDGKLDYQEFKPIMENTQK